MKQLTFIDWARRNYRDFHARARWIDQDRREGTECSACHGEESRIPCRVCNGYGTKFAQDAVTEYREQVEIDKARLAAMKDLV